MLVYELYVYIRYVYIFACNSLLKLKLKKGVKIYCKNSFNSNSKGRLYIAHVDRNMTKLIRS